LKKGDKSVTISIIVIRIGVAEKGPDSIQYDFNASRMGVIKKKGGIV